MEKQKFHCLCIILLLFVCVPAVFCWDEVPSPNGFPRFVHKPHYCAWNNGDIIFPLKGKGLLLLRNGEWELPDMTGFPTYPDTLSELPSLIYYRDSFIPWEGNYHEPLRLITHQNLPGTVWCITQEPGGIYITQDYGENWTQFGPVTFQECQYSNIAIHPVSTDTMVILADNYPLLSFDGGTNWSPLFSDSQDDTILSHVVDACFNPNFPYEMILFGYFEHEVEGESTILGEIVGVNVEGEILYNLNNSPHISPYGEIFTDPNIGTNIASWSVASPQISVFDRTSGSHRLLGDIEDGDSRILGFNHQNGTLYSFVRTRHQSNRIIRAYPSGWQESDRTEITFSNLDLEDSFPQGIVTGSDNMLYLSLLSGLIYSVNNSNEAQWALDIPVSSGVHQTIYDEHSGILYSWGSSGIFYTNDLGVTWHRIVEQGVVRAALTSNGNHLYFSTIKNKLYKTNSLGETTELPLPFEGSQAFDFYADPVEPERLYLQTNSVTSTLYISSNMGTDWALLYYLPTTQRCIAFDQQLPGNMFSLGDALYYSEDFGFNWIELSLPEQMSHGQVIFAGLTNGDDCIVAGDGGVFRTNNLGESWELISSEIEFLQQTNRSYSPQAGFIKNDPLVTDGFFLLETGKKLWRYDPANNVLNQVDIPESGFPSDIESYNNSLILAQSNGSIYIEDRFQGFSNDDSDPANLPNSMELSVKLSPNPFNHEQTFNISGIVQGDIEISIYTIEGRLLTRKTLFASTTNMRIPFSSLLNTRELSSGIYLVNIQSGARITTVKSLFIK